MSKCPVCGKERGASQLCPRCRFRDIVPSEAQQTEYERLICAAREQWNKKQEAEREQKRKEREEQERKEKEQRAKQEAERKEREKQAAALKAQEALRAQREALEREAQAKRDAKAHQKRQQEAQAKKEAAAATQPDGQTAALRAQNDLRAQREAEQKAKQAFWEKLEAEAQKKREAEARPAEKQPQTKPAKNSVILPNVSSNAPSPSLPPSVEAGIAQQMELAEKRLEKTRGLYYSPLSPDAFLDQLKRQLQKEFLLTKKWDGETAARAGRLVETALAARADGKIRFLGAMAYRTTEKRHTLRTVKVSRSAGGMQILGAGKPIELFYQLENGKQAAFFSQHSLPKGLWTLTTQVLSGRLCLFAQSSGGKRLSLGQCDAWSC